MDVISDLFPFVATGNQVPPVNRGCDQVGPLQNLEQELTEGKEVVAF